MHHLNPVLPSSDSFRPLFLTGAICGASLFFWEAPAQCTMAVLACVFAFCFRRRVSQKRTFGRDQSLQWW